MEYNKKNHIRILACDDALKQLPYKLKELSVTRPMIITDEFGANLGALKSIEKALNGFVQPAVICTKVQNTAQASYCEQLVIQFRKKDCDSIIVTGGVNTITTAKALKLMLAYDVSTFQSFNVNVIAEKAYKDYPLVVVVDDIATGMEGNVKIDIKDNRTNRLYRLQDYRMQTDSIILDSKLIDVLPPQSIAVRGLYGICKACRCIIGANGNEFMQSEASAALSMICKHFINAVKKNANHDLTHKISVGIVLAGLSYATFKDDLYTQIARELIDYYQVSPAKVNIILFFHNFEEQINDLNEKEKEAVLSQLALAITDTERRLNLDSNQIPQEIKKFFIEAAELTEMPLTLSELGVNKDELVELAKRVSDNSKEAKFSQVLEILNRAIGENKVKIVKTKQKKEKKIKKKA